MAAATLRTRSSGSCPGASRGSFRAGAQRSQCRVVTFLVEPFGQRPLQPGVCLLSRDPRGIIEEEGDAVIWQRQERVEAFRHHRDLLLQQATHSAVDVSDTLAFAKRAVVQLTGKGAHATSKVPEDIEGQINAFAGVLLSDAGKALGEGSSARLNVGKDVRLVQWGITLLA